MEKYPARLDHLFEHLQFILNHNHNLSICQLLEKLTDNQFKTSNIAFMRNAKDMAERIMAANTSNYELLFTGKNESFRIVVLNKTTNEKEIWIQDPKGDIQFGAFTYKYWAPLKDSFLENFMTAALKGNK